MSSVASPAAQTTANPHLGSLPGHGRAPDAQPAGVATNEVSMQRAAQRFVDECSARRPLEPKYFRQGLHDLEKSASAKILTKYLRTEGTPRGPVRAFLSRVFTRIRDDEPSLEIMRFNARKADRASETIVYLTETGFRTNHSTRRLHDEALRGANAGPADASVAMDRLVERLARGEKLPFAYLEREKWSSDPY